MAVGNTAIWRVRPSGSNTNGGGYDPGISGAATDYSQQNAAQASGVNGTASGTATFSDSTANAFTSAMIGNAIWIASGAGFTVGAYFVTAFTSASTVTLDRSPGTGTVAHWALGGGWADLWTNIDVSGNFGTTAGTWLVAGNTVYVLGSGTPNPSSYVYDYTMTASFQPPDGNTTNGLISFVNDPATPGYKAPPDTTGGMPVIKRWTGSNSINLNNYQRVVGLWVVSVTGSTFGLITSSACFLEACVFDQFGVDSICMSLASSSGVGCEVFNSGSATAGSNEGVDLGTGYLIGCNIHDLKNRGVFINGTGNIINCIIAKCSATGIEQSTTGCLIINNTIDGNGGNGIEVDSVAVLQRSSYINNIITNHTGVSKSGLVVDAGSATSNTALVSLADYNSYYNNTANYTAINAGPHDTALVVTPYVASSTENYTLA